MPGLTAPIDGSLSNLQEQRRERLSALGVSEQAAAHSIWPSQAAARDGGADTFRVMSYSVLPDGNPSDGFLLRPVLANSSSVADLDCLLDETVAARGDLQKLAALRARYESPSVKENASAVADWDARALQLQLAVLASGSPDILIFQGLDKYCSLARELSKLGYTSKLPAVASDSYMPAHCEGHSDADLESAAKFCRSIESKGHAFLPQLGSPSFHSFLVERGLGAKLVAISEAKGLRDKVVDTKTRRLARTWAQGLSGGSLPLLRAVGISDPSSLDDMGVAIFWRSQRFTAIELRAFSYGSGNGGLLEVLLREAAPTSLEHETSGSGGRDVVVLATQLLPGDSSADEQKRLQQQVESAYESQSLCALAAKHRSAGAAVLLAVDSNSHPQHLARDGKSSCWRSLHKTFGASVWDADFDNYGNQLSSSYSPVSTNAIRKPAMQGRAGKAGAWRSYSLPDHIFFNPDALAFQSHVYAPKRFASELNALNELVPSLANPSSHYPVVVDLAWTTDSKNPPKKRKVGGA